MRTWAAQWAFVTTTVFATIAAGDPIVIDASHRLGDVPAHDGDGVAVRWVHGFFPGFPFHIEDARDLLDERAVIPAFETWCGALPYIDLGNRSVGDSLGRGAPTLLCAPFLEARDDGESTCRRLDGVPTGRYWRNGGAAMRAEGALAIREAGVYTFAFGHDDGVSLRFGATRVYEFADGTAPRVDLATVRFDAAGLYPFTLEWFDGIGGAIIDWYVSRGARERGEFSNFTFELVPTRDLYARTESACTEDCRRCAAPTPVCDRARGVCVGCDAQRGCGRCARCVAGQCVADPSRPDCAPDAGSPEGSRDAEATHDAASSPDASSAAPGAGCGCATRSPSSSGALASIALLCLRSRRRRR